MSLIHSQVTIGNDNPAFVALAELIETSSLQGFTTDRWHRDDSAPLVRFREALEAVPDNMLINGRIQTPHPSLSHQSNQPVSVEQYARQQGENALVGPKAEEANSLTNPGKWGNYGDNTRNRKAVEGRVNQVVGLIKEAVAAAKERVGAQPSGVGENGRVEVTVPQHQR